MRSRLLVALIALVAAIFPAHAAAFCGFYVGSGGPLVNDATQVVLMRAGVRTVLSMTNDYRGPPEGFALVVPVPVVLREENVRTLPRAVFQQIERLDAPRLVEYWEQDPCPEPEPSYDGDKEGGTGTRAKGEEGSMGRPTPKPLVKVEAEFSVDEYEIVILSALDAVALDTWLREHGYKIPEGADRYLRPYVQGGSKFFVAKVDPRKIAFRWGRATLSPLRFHYDSDTFALPVRLGLMNADGPQDLVVHILAPERYETANYENLFIPTNLEVTEPVRDQFPSFYASLFDRTVKDHPRAVVTEYAWSASSCDPCPAPPLGQESLDAFGADVIDPAARQTAPTITRLHARYTRETLGEDLIFRPAPAIEGGREEGYGKNQKGARKADRHSTFQARYILRHRWEGPVTCSDPAYGMWGGPPGGRPPTPASAARSNAARRDLPLEAMLAEDSADLGVRAKTPRSPPDRFDLRRGVERLLRSSSLLFTAIAGALVLVAWAARRAREPVLRRMMTLVALVGPPFLLIFPNATRRLVLDAGPYLYAPLAAFVLCLAAALVLRRRDRADGVLVALPVLPALVAMLRTAAAFAVGLAASRAPDVDPATALLIQTGSQSEALAVLVLGFWMSALLFVVVAWPRVSEDGPRPLHTPILVATTTAMIAAAGLRLRLEGPHWTIDAALIAVISIGGLAAQRITEGDPRGARRAVAGIAAAAFLAAIAGLVFEHHLGLGAISGETVDPEQKLTLLTRMLAQERTRLLLLPIDTLGAAAAVAWAARRAGAAADTSGWKKLAPGLVAMAVVIVAGGAMRASFDRHFAVIGERWDRFSARSGVNLPVVPPADIGTGDAVQRKLGGPALYVTADGKLLASEAAAAAPRAYEPSTWDALAAPATDADLADAPILAADGKLRFDALLRALDPITARRQIDFSLLLTPRDIDPARAGLYRGLVGPGDLRTIAVQITPTLALAPAVKEPAGSPRARTLGLLADGDRARAVLLRGKLGVYARAPGDVPPTLPLGTSPQDLAEWARFLDRLDGPLREIVLTVPPSLDMDHLLRRLAALTQPASHGRRDRLSVKAFVLTPDAEGLRKALDTP